MIAEVLPAHLYAGGRDGKISHILCSRARASSSPQRRRRPDASPRSYLSALGCGNSGEILCRRRARERDDDGRARDTGNVRKYRRRDITAPGVCSEKAVRRIAFDRSIALVSRVGSARIDPTADDDDDNTSTRAPRASSRPPRHQRSSGVDT